MKSCDVRLGEIASLCEDEIFCEVTFLISKWAIGGLDMTAPVVYYTHARASFGATSLPHFNRDTATAATAAK